MKSIHNNHKPGLKPAVKLLLFMPEKGNVLAVPNSSSLPCRLPTCLIGELTCSVG